MTNLEQQIGGEDSRKLIVIGNVDEDLSRYARARGLSLRSYETEESYRKDQVKNTRLGDFTRKSVVGAVYRVGASFAMDAIYLTAAGALAYYLNEKADAVQSALTAASDFVHNLDPWKLGRVAAFVVGINFADYKWDITNRLDKVAKKTGSYLFRKNKT